MKNIFIFGLTAQQAEAVKADHYNPMDYYYANEEMRQVLDMIGSGYFSPSEPKRFENIINSLTHWGDHYLVLADYADYIRCQESVSELYRDQTAWTQKAILNTANMGKFSSDRTIKEYAAEIWNTQAVDIELKHKHKRTNK